MKYFIDFEATQFSSEIISVGCVNSVGEEFYSLVRPMRMGKMTDFITNLTGITREELREAPDADSVFSDFYAWMHRDEKAQFYCYGNCDVHFVRNTLRHVQQFEAQAALSLIQASVYDYSLRAREFFDTDQTVGLAKLVEYYSGETIDQKHNSLEDAEYLSFVYERMHTLGQPETCPFPDYQSRKKRAAMAEAQAEAQARTQTYKKYVMATGDRGTFVFPSYGKAADWVIETLMKNAPADDRAKSRIANRIANAVQRRGTYYGFEWSAGSN